MTRCPAKKSPRRRAVEGFSLQGDTPPCAHEAHRRGRPPGVKRWFLWRFLTAFQQERKPTQFLGERFFWVGFWVGTSNQTKLATEKFMQVQFEFMVFHLGFFEDGWIAILEGVPFRKYHAIRCPSKDLRFGAPCNYKKTTHASICKLSKKRKACRAPAFQFF